MNYFTPDLLARYGSTEDGVALAASEEWERALDDYAAHLNAIEASLPQSVRIFLEKCCLHDARVLANGGRREARMFVFVLRPDGQTDVSVHLIYKLTADSPRIQRHPVQQGGKEPLAWLYDEFDVQKIDDEIVCTHSILFTGGWEVQLTFQDFEWGEYQHPLIPAENDSTAEAIV